MHILEDAVKVIDNGYDILRQRATEVMVWVITDKNRSSNTQMPCSLPIDYGIKDYRLPGELMRNASDHMLRVKVDFLAEMFGLITLPAEKSRVCNNQ